MSTDIRIDLQVEGMGVRGHHWLFTTDEGKSWWDAEMKARAFCALYQKPVEVTMSEFEPYKEGRTLIGSRFIGRFVPYQFAPGGVVYIDADVYAQID